MVFKQHWIPHGRIARFLGKTAGFESGIGGAPGVSRTFCPAGYQIARSVSKTTALMSKGFGSQLKKLLLRKYEAI